MVASLTKVPLTTGEIEAVVRAAFGEGERVAAARPALGGMYNAGYHLDLVGGGPPRAFLKAAPPAELPCLTHEQGLMRAEIDTLRRVAAAGVGAAPRLLFADVSRRIVPRDVIVLEHLPGALLSETEVAEADAPALRRQIGALAAGIQAVVGPAFGYPHDPALQAATWAEALGRMLEAVFDDARRLGVDPPLEPLRARFLALLPMLGDVREPRLVHYDLWDGNILIERAGQGWAVTGFIDWERAFYGDPLAELVSLSFHTPTFALDPAVLKGWRSVAPLDLDGAVRRRIALYRGYLWLIMLTEAGPRGFLETQPRDKWPAIRRRLAGDLAVAEGADP
jgi:Ser/Thr protein kinase RdoA (MazF antagonist)